MSSSSGNSTSDSQRISIFICGVQKAGTTSLFSHLCDHPELCAPSRKELHVFDDEKINWSDPDYSVIDKFFVPQKEGGIRFEATPIYAFWPTAMERIARYNPDAKLIFIFRDPLERAWSQWCMEWARGAETLLFADAIRSGRNRLNGLAPIAPEQRVFTYLERGLYSQQVERALRYFPREQLLFLKSEDLRDRHVSTLERVADFLGIGDFPSTAAKREHLRPEATLPCGPTASDRALVASFVRDDLSRFSALTGLDISNWPTGKVSTSKPALVQSGTAIRTPPNILMIIADDLNSWIGALGVQPDVKTPAIDALARRGTLFSRAYCAAPYCNASRMSVFTACLPTTTGIYKNEPLWDKPDRRPAYIELFRESGYYTFGAGKVFHGVYDYAGAGFSASDRAGWREIENRSHLWDQFEKPTPEPLPSSRPMNRLFDFENFDAVPPMYHHFDWGPLPNAMEGTLPDETVCKSVTEFLLGAPREPFFCAAGIYKPHLPWHVPERFFDLYDRELLTLPTIREDDLEDVPSVGRSWALSPKDHELVTSNGQWRAAVQGYLASISYCDWIIGRIVEALDRSGLADNTLIVLWGDNGFHLGEKLHWRKFALWEESTRVPLIIVPPKGVAVKPFYDHPVGLIDIFPTLAGFCGVDDPSHVNGRSLIRAMTHGSGLNLPVITTWGKGNHSVRSDDWRYTRYIDGGEELYNHRTDPHEWSNLAQDSRFHDQIRRLRQWIPADLVPADTLAASSGS